jgi:hypothetical protein
MEMCIVFAVEPEGQAGCEGKDGHLGMVEISRSLLTPSGC